MIPDAAVDGAKTLLELDEGWFTQIITWNSCPKHDLRFAVAPTPMPLPVIKLDRVRTRADNLRTEAVCKEGADAVRSCAYSFPRCGPISTHNDYSVRRVRVEERSGVLSTEAAMYITI